MAIKSAEGTRRNFDAMLIPKLSDEAHKAVNEAFDAISIWRSDILSNSEKTASK
jgi:hypothetical protein